MRAWVVEKPAPIEQGPIRLLERDIPDPGDDQVAIRVTVCGVCRTDLHVVEGDLAPRRTSVIPGHQIVGEVTGIGNRAQGLRIGQRVGVAWVHRTCGECRFCTTGRENLCEGADFTGWTVDGGYAEHCVATADFVHALPDGFDDLQAAPLLCAGIIGYRTLRLVEPHPWPGGLAGQRLGIYGFGAAGHVVIQLARAHGADVYVMTRDRQQHQALADELGALWVGGAHDRPPKPLDAALVFAPAGALVPVALRALDRGGKVVLGGIHMSTIPAMEYSLLYGERLVRTVANNTRQDARDFLAEAARIPIRTQVREFPLAEADRALAALKNHAIRGAAVLRA